MFIFSSIRPKLGFSAFHFPSLATASLNDDHHFPMASTFKLPLAIYLLSKEPSLDVKLKINKHDVRDGSGVVKRRFSEGMELSLRELIEFMMIYSDNTATDVLLKRSGGPDSLTRWLKDIGIEETIIRHSCLEILASHYGIKNITGDCTPELFERYKQQISPKEQKKAAQEYFDAMPDRTTPRSMLFLLKTLMTSSLISLESRDFLLRCMQKNTMGAQRIRKNVPENLFVVDKTGTLGNLTADVGGILSSNLQEYLLISVYVIGGISLKQREKLIAKTALQVYKKFSNPLRDTK